MNLLKLLIDAVYPSRCPYCNNVIDRNFLICDNCNKSIKSSASIRELKIRDNDIKVKCISPLRYRNEVVHAIHRFKFRGHKSYSKEFASRIVNALNTSLPDADFDFVTSVPLSSKRRLDRGYNQSELVAREVANILSVPYKDVIKKIKNNAIQHNLPNYKRIENVKGAYLAINLDIINDSKILLCDDVITTGSTISECAKVLVEAQAKNVTCATIANAE